MARTPCPLCRNPQHRPRLLYGCQVCRRCYYKFANRRQFGYVIDALLWWPISYYLLAGIAVVLDSTGLDPGTSDMTYLVMAWLIVPLIFFCKDGFSGHSPGKWLMRVRAVNRNDFRPIGFGASLKRNLILLIPLMPLIIAGLLQKGYRLGDGWAHSKVIWKRYAKHPVFTGRLACEACQFDLTGNTSGICPECGTPVPGAEAYFICATCRFDLTGNTSGICPECGTPRPERHRPTHEMFT